MKRLRLFLWPLAAAAVGTLVALAAGDPDPGQVEISVARLLEQVHYSKRKLDDNLSKQLLKNYLELLDYNHLFFTQKDVDEFSKKYATSLDESIGQGSSEPAFTIHKVYKARVEQRITRAKEMLGDKFDFKSDRAIEINRQKSPWPKDDAAAEQLWRDRIENELLAEQLSKTEKDPLKRLTKRYDQMLRNLREQSNDDVVNNFLLALTLTYDPHSEYMSKSQLENFEINMRLSLVGIGAVLQSDEGYAKIAELVPGGPASKSGELKVGDRICGVAQGEKEFVDTVDMKLDKVVEMIRGKKETVVRLQVIPSNAADPSARKVVTIKREEVKLKEAEAKAELIERPAPGGPVRYGWITLPSFYADMGKHGASGAKSTTKDVRALLERLKQENIQGLVIDLRRNGGGSLEEAVNLTGLFIKKGPVVQSKDSNGNMQVLKDRDSSVVYEGPVIVLTNKLSASASEIFAAALQDYNRALIVGDSSTFGKGTVQQMLEIGQVMPFLGGGKEAGALKLTIQKFYRVAGGSTQLRGVEADVKLPSIYDNADLGEASLKGPLPYDTVDPVPFDRAERPLFKNELRERSTARITKDQEFAWINEDLDRMKKRIAENKLVLNLDQRKAEIDEDKTRKEARKEARAKIVPAEEKRFSLTLDNVAKPELELVKIEKPEKEEPKAANADAPQKIEPKPDEPKPAAAADDDEADAEDEDPKLRVDAVRAEALHILADFIELAGKAPATAAAVRSAAK